MAGKDEKTQIEAFESAGSSKMPRATKRRRKNRGMPPPATFDIDTLPGSSNLTALEAAAVIRRTPGALEQWRRDPNHPLKWRYVDGPRSIVSMQCATIWPDAIRPLTLI
ncbi:hypothetical protein [Bradyrhizobium sp. SSUT77]|uniref:hypothetical protein n=1 Tax=Bradyrhizobium sp. SSUT77 TaxID=3040603 RepID=UPI002448E866|nr:hypothetical protein [Bradyrhizobium sp. SSUT77]MDH2348144.1 hypothetical protein [Bradyrhizobium sp. SSUT77]